MSLESTKSSTAGPSSSSISSSGSPYVYIYSKDYAWVPAKLVEMRTSTNEAIVQIQSMDVATTSANKSTTKSSFFNKSNNTYNRKQSGGGSNNNGAVGEIITVSLKDYPNGTLPLQNVSRLIAATSSTISPSTSSHLTAASVIDIVDDMIYLNYLHEASILYNIRARHASATPYTRTGYNLMIATNPYQWLNHYYTPQQQIQYIHQYLQNNNTCSKIDPDNNKEGGGAGVTKSTQLPPHVYEVSALAYKGLYMDSMNQSILVSGESGAGKTETVKICLNHFATISNHMQQTDGNHSVTAATNINTEQTSNFVQQRIVDSNPLLEAFGNATTIKNDNSSRFGKHIQLQFAALTTSGQQQSSLQLVGSTCDVYLLEKSRVVTNYNHSNGNSHERNYHIFYQLLSANDTIKHDIWDGLVGTTSQSFSYTTSGTTNSHHVSHMIEGRTDAEWFTQTVKALHLIDIKDDVFRMLFRSICIVLQMGNIIFASNIDDREGSTIITDDELLKLGELMGISDVQIIQDAMTYRTIEARNEIVKTKVTAERAKDACDAFAKEIYHTTFLWLVQQINHATCADRNYTSHPNAHKFGTIGLLDIFGFESFDKNNGFEQLCINYANEMLQQKFTQDIFTTVMIEYQDEGIELDEIRFNDNRHVLDCIEGKKNGLISILNEESFRPNGNDTTFVYKITAAHANNTPCFITNKLYNDYQFGIQHYAGPVIYNAEHFVMKNTDHIPNDLKNIAKLCSNTIISHHLQANNHSATNDNSTTRNNGGGPSNSIAGVTVWTKFKNQLHTLMKQIGTTQTRYIRCIKPNNCKAPLIMDNVSTLQQLRCAGVVAAVTISRSAFPNRLYHSNVLDQFHFLWPKNGTRCTDYNISMIERYKADITTLLTTAFKDFVVKDEIGDGKMIKKAYVIGHTRTYFRAGALEYLESQRLTGMNLWAAEIQKIVRGAQQRRVYQRQLQSVLTIQKSYRRFVSQMTYVKVLRDVTTVQSLYRRMVAKRKVENLLTISIAATKVQRIIRGYIQRRKYRKAIEKQRNLANTAYQLELMKEEMLQEEVRRKEEYEKEQELTRRKAEEDMLQQMKEMQLELARKEARCREEHERQLELVKKAMEEKMAKQKLLEEQERQKEQQLREQELARKRMQEEAAMQLEKMKLQMAEQEARRKAELDREIDLARKTEQEDRIRRLEAEVREMKKHIITLREENDVLILKNEAAQLAMEAAAKEQLISNEEKARASPQTVVEPEVRIVEVIKYVENEESKKLAEEQQILMEESSKIIEFLRNENLKLKKKMESQKKDFNAMKENNQRLMEANASAGGSFNSLNQHAKQLSATNQNLLLSVAKYRNKVTELHAEMKHRQTYYREVKEAYQVETEVRSYYEKAVLEIVNKLTKKEYKQACDPSLHKFIMMKAMACAKMGQKLVDRKGDDASVMMDNEPPPIQAVEIYNDDAELDENQLAI